MKIRKRDRVYVENMVKIFIIGAIKD